MSSNARVSSTLTVGTKGCGRCGWWDRKRMLTGAHNPWYASVAELVDALVSKTSGQ